VINFPTDIQGIENRLLEIDPVKYAATRNHKNGAVTHLSPFISRGVISTRQVYEHLQSLDLPWYKKEKLIQELAWRDYWQQVWIAKKDRIRQDLKNVQTPISNYQIPKAIIHANTGIFEVDHAIEQLYASGYMHNHMRMYVASICCNIAHSHWLEPAKWMYGHLLDGDLASNFLSWQWVAGTFSNKKYYANQNNINNFFNSTQQNTFLDVEYNAFENLEIPDILNDTLPFEIEMALPRDKNPTLYKDKTTLIYNYYNIDPYWYKDKKAQRIFLMEPSFYKENPINQKCIDFALELTRNIDGIKIYIGEFSELKGHIHPDLIVYKEHPTNSHYKGKEEPREWLSNITGYFPSFFAFWKKCKKEL
jgi:deoxyribodipyrimidine photo-lyase